MAHVLVVDDEPRYRAYVARLLEAEGHRVRGAGSAREAIERGAREPADVAIVDWMLGGALHGLHVLDALRAVWPGLPCVLITGFPSAELEASARRAGVARLLEKPFEPAELCAAVEDALSSPLGADEPGLAMVELEPDRTLRGASRDARALLGVRSLERGPSLDSLLAAESGGELERAAERWVRTTPRAARGEPWWLRAQSPAETGGGRTTRLAVLHRGASPPDAETRARTELLLGLDAESGAAALRPPVSGPVLLVDPDLFLRRVATSLLEEAGVPVLAAESGERALALLDGAPAFRVAVVDEAVDELEALVGTLRSRYSSVTLVGQADGLPCEPLQALGVDAVLRKPWRLRQLGAAVAARRDGRRD